MSTPEKPRRPMRLALEKDPAAPKPWKVRTPDGQVRGPLGLVEIRALVDVDIVASDAEIAAASGEDERWQRLEVHALWAELSPAFQLKAAKRTKAETPPKTESVALPIAFEISPAMQARLDEARERETHKLWRGMMLAEVIGVVRGVREVVVFFAFIAAGDLLTAFISSPLGIVRWIVLMGVMAVALGYYIVRGLWS